MRIGRAALALILPGLVLAGAATPARAAFVAAVAITPDPGNVTNNGQGYTLGYSFTLNTPVTVNELGYFDYNGAAFTESHAVGLWDSTGHLLASTTVNNSGTVVGQFRYNSIANLALSTGETYVVAGLSGVVDKYASNPTTTAFNPRVHYVSNRYDLGSSLAFPTSSATSVVGFFGGTFGFADPGTAVPEPSSLLMLGLGAAGVFGGRAVRRKLRAAN